MSKEKAALFVDNSNIFKGMQKYSNYLYKKNILKKGQFLRMQWDKLIEVIENQNGGLDIYARHFFASLPPAADVSSLQRRPTEEEWDTMVKNSAQSGFYKVIQEPPFNFTLHGIPLRFAEVFCHSKMRQAYYHCKNSQIGNFKCELKLNLDECYKCKNKFLFKYEKGVDVDLAIHLLIYGAIKTSNLERIILVAGDGDYKEAAKYIRHEVGKDFQIISWQRALSKDLEKISNKPTIYLENIWETVCEIKMVKPLEEMPADLDETLDEEE